MGVRNGAVCAVPLDAGLCPLPTVCGCVLGWPFVRQTLGGEVLVIHRGVLDCKLHSGTEGRPQVGALLPARPPQLWDSGVWKWIPPLFK